ncbi:TadE/TadG family type IV pilus assembly protein [Rhodovulum sp. DZ06]|uniref:TadE/TadG family type IV pilus assembly protein n=1 Tax=Rhodovulum sp. DZ06 TaxID=3425126 RepID=UPI003D330F3D
MSLRDALRSAFKERRGGATVEFVVWLPFFLSMLAVFTDIALILNTRARMVNAATEAAIAFAVNHDTEAEAEAIAIGYFQDFEPGEMTAKVTPDGSGNTVTAEISTSFSSVMLFTGNLLFSDILAGDKKLTATMRRIVEPAPEGGS